MTPTLAAELTASCLALGIATTTAEDWLYRSSLFGSGGCLARPAVERLIGQLGPIDAVILGAFGPLQGTRLFLVLRLFSAMLLLCVWQGGWLAFLSVATVLLLQLVHLRRMPIGLDGSDQMTTIILFALFIGFWPSAEHLRLSEAYITAQITTAYATTGLAKLFSPAWRSGAGFAGTMNTALYGNCFLSGLLAKHRLLPPLVSLGVYGGQLLLACAFALGGDFAAPAVALAACFHLGVAITMRLTAFPLAFGAALPSVLFMADAHERLGVLRSFLE